MSDYILIIIITISAYFGIVRNMKWLTEMAYLVALSFAASIFIAFGPSYLIYPVIFLISGSALGRLKGREEKETRDAWQVWANGFWGFAAALMAIITKDSSWSEVFILTYSIATADTWSSEIGRRYGGVPKDVLTRKPLKPGLSGGISTIGNIGAIMGIVMMLSAAFVLSHLTIQKGLVIAILAYLGMYFDSILGSLIQGKYLGNDGEVKEEGNAGNLIRGLAFINNNRVNYLSIGSVTLGYVVAKWIVT